MKDMRDVLYIGLEVCDKQAIKDLFDFKTWDKVFCDHVTLEFNPSEDSEILKWVLEHEGEKVSVRYDKFGHLTCENGTLIAMGVSLPEGVPCKNSQPHITLALSGEGMRPFMSNNIKNWWTVEAPMDIECQVRVWCRR